MKVYIKGSKKVANEKIAAGEQVSGIEYSMFNERYATPHTINECEEGTIVAFFTNTSDGIPISRSFGTWDGTKIK
jgi:hypothetical protein